MSHTNRVRSVMLAVATVLIVLPVAAEAQQPVARFNDPATPATNNLPNPYQSIDGWARMPAGREWASTSAVYIDPDGQSIWVGERCGGNIGACVNNPNVDPILKFDANGNLVASFGAGTIAWPHGIHVDREGNVWVTDGRDNRPAGPGAQDAPQPHHVYGHQIHKFSPTGAHLMTLGQPGGDNEAGYFWQPNDVLVGPNGDIFVGEGHSNAGRSRILKFNSRGEFIKEWGQTGNGPADLMQPHGLAMDSQGRLFVADRSNNRIQIYDQEGNLLDTWYQFSRPSGVFIDANDVIYVADSESNSVNRDPARADWLRGIRIGNARTGEVQYFIPDPNPDCTGTCTAEGVTADRNGVIYGAEVGPAPGRLMRYVR